MYTDDSWKIFVGGLSWQTTSESLKEYFSKYGEITEVIIMKDPNTKRSRGFGFITFAASASVEKVLEQEIHELDGKKIDPKVAFPRLGQPRMVTRTKKVFVGGISAQTTVDDVKTYFEQFGEIAEAMLMFDKQTNRHRGFGFVTFLSEEVVDNVCEIQFHIINNKMVQCKKAQPQEVMMLANMAKSRATNRVLNDYMYTYGQLPEGPSNAYAAYLFSRGFNGFPSFGIPCPSYRNDYCNFGFYGEYQVGREDLIVGRQDQAPRKVLFRYDMHQPEERIKSYASADLNNGQLIPYHNKQMFSHTYSGQLKNENSREYENWRYPSLVN